MHPMTTILPLDNAPVSPYPVFDDIISLAIALSFGAGVVACLWAATVFNYNAHNDEDASASMSWGRKRSYAIVGAAVLTAVFSATIAFFDGIQANINARYNAAVGEHLINSPSDNITLANNTAKFFDTYNIDAEKLCSPEAIAHSTNYRLDIVNPNTLVQCGGVGLGHITYGIPELAEVTVESFINDGAIIYRTHAK